MKNYNDNNYKSSLVRFRSLLIIAVSAILIIGACAAFSGCGANTVTEINKANDTVYLAQVNSVSKSINGELSNFSQFVKEKDVEAMQNTYNKVQDQVDTLAHSVVPENMADAHNSYISAFTQLQASLKDYIQIYSDMKSGAQTHDVLTQRIATVQTEYNQGINMMQDAEKKASAAVAA